jgi:hypothetical protein
MWSPTSCWRSAWSRWGSQLWGAVAQVVTTAHNRDARVLCRQLRLDRPRSSRSRRVRLTPRGNRSARPTGPQQRPVDRRLGDEQRPAAHHPEPPALRATHLARPAAVVIAAGRHPAVRERERPTVPRPSRRSGDDGTRTHDPLLAKPVRAGSSPVTAGECAARRHPGVVRGCPQGTGQDRCEWHGSGTAGEHDCGAGPAATVPARAIGEASPGGHEPRWQAAAAARQCATAPP